MSLTVPFILDVSANQDHPIDWQAVKAAGCQGVVLKATQGDNYVNPTFTEDLDGCNAADLPVMAYHFAEFGNYADEVAFFRSVAGARARALDIETSENVAWANKFLAELQKKGSLSEQQTLLYGSSSSLNVIRRAVHARLWVAHYVTEAPEAPGVPGTAMWQYSESGQVPGIDNAVDLNKWLGSARAFAQFFGVAP